MFPVATPDTQLFAISTSEATEKNSNNLQKQQLQFTRTITRTITITIYKI